MALNRATTLKFLTGDSEMGELIRQHDWASTAVGRPQQWPQTLRTILSVLLRAPVPMLLWWGPDFIQFYNDAYRPVLDTTGDHPTALGQRGESCRPKIWPEIKPLIDQVLAGNEVTGSQNELIPIARNGGVEDGHWTPGYSPVWNEADQVAGVLVVYQETTLHIRTLQEDRDQFNFAIEGLNFGVWAVDPVKRMFHWDNQCTILFNQNSTHALTMEQIFRNVHTDDVDRVRKNLSWAMNPQSGGLYENIYRLPGTVEGRQRWVKSTGQAYCDSAGELTWFMGVSLDYTNEMEAQRQIKATEAYLKSVFRHAAVAIAIFQGTDLVIELANPRTCSIWGHSESDVLGKPMIEALPELAGQGFDVLLADVMRTGQPYVSRELPVTLVQNGQSVTSCFDIAFEPLPDPDGRVNRVLVTAIDVTERMHTRQHIEQLLVRERELNELKSNFVTLASHEFRTPMALILSSAALIGHYNGVDDADHRNRHVQRIKSEIQGLTSLLEDFLSLSRMEQQSLYSHPYPLDIRDFCQNLVQNMQGIIKPGQRMVYRHGSEEQAISLDGQLLKTILINLLINASKYSDDEKKIELTTSVQNDQLLVSVIDEGIGIPNQDRDKLFTNFFRAANVTQIEGTGLGLYVVKRYVDLMGGTINFTSQLGSGTVFTVQLPSFSLPQPPSA